MAQTPLELLAHREWLGQIQQVGLVVSPTVFVKQGVFVDRQAGVETQSRLRELVDAPFDFITFAQKILDWPAGSLSGAPGGRELPDSLTVALPAYEDELFPTYVVPAPSGQDTPAAEAAQGGAGDRWLGLVSVAPYGADLDRTPADRSGWPASPHARLERLLRETGVPIGLLFNGHALRLVYAPQGETSGHLTFTFAHLVQTQGWPMASALPALLGYPRISDLSVEEQRLPALLRESRRYQNEVSTALAGQVLEALWELLRGFQRADDDSKRDLLREVLREDPHEVYGGLLATLMRLVFVLYAEDRGLMPEGDVYQRNYSLSGLFQRLREDQARYPDTMDARYGAWAQLLALFRLIHDGGSHGGIRFPPRHGRLFDPDAYPFLEGRPPHSARQLGAVLEVPKVPDGTIFRVLQNLLVLAGERLSYRALDVEQIGSVYEAMMGFALEVAAAPSIAVAPKHVVVDLCELLEQKGKDRAAWLKERAELKVGSDALSKAASIPDLVAALGSRVSRYTPNVLTVGAVFLQPTEERRRSGSHYTPRSLTEPIVRTTLRPILERLGEKPTPQQILDLRVCDPAMGSGAFLVEACRLLAERLVKAWETHKATPVVPEDEDALTLARRLVAERCLYGVDKNIFAVDLAKLSLWLATLAREHPFTFLDHALRHGDSLVGLSREQIACLHWNPGKQLPLIRTFLDVRVSEAQRLREQIQGMGSSDDVPGKARLLKEAEETIGDVRVIADVIASAFFDRDKPRDREALRTVSAGKIENWLPTSSLAHGLQLRDEGSAAIGLDLRALSRFLRDGARGIPAFHWEIEFPEVFTRDNGGFDAFVGNPPFMGGTKISSNLGTPYLDYLLQIHDESHGNGDLVAHFYRRGFKMLRDGGAFGLIATNTIAQGDTRATGLRWIRKHGGSIYAARTRVKWPDSTAAVVVSTVHIAKGPIHGRCDLNDRSTQAITAFLFPAGPDDDPEALRANRDKSFLGCKIYGQGFTFDDGDADANPVALMHKLLREDRRNGERIFPYIGGEELNESPTQDHRRYVINFEQIPLRREEREETWADADARVRLAWRRSGIVPLDYPDAVAADWPQLLQIVEEKVKPERLLLGGNPSAVERRRLWWQFGRYTPALFDAMRSLQRVLAVSQVGNRLAFAFQPTDRVFSHAVCLFAFASGGAFSVLQSRLHEIWARLFGSSMKDDLRYTPSDCLETFPFPAWLESNQDLEQAGCSYYDFRAALMIRNNEGLTKTYNRFHDPDERDPDIVTLRDLHDAMDRAVLDAYGWTNIRPTCEFILDYEDDEDETPGRASRRRKPWRYRWADDVRDGVLGKLLQLNAERAEEERLAAEAAAKAAASAIGTAGHGRPKAARSRKAETRDTPLLD